jgi:uncharacterized damage-inducible protein DinB
MREPFRLPFPAPSPLDLLLAQLVDGRARTLRVVEALPESSLHWSSAEFPNSVAAHLAHLGAIELDWLYCDLLGREIPAQALEGCPITDVRDGEGRLDQAGNSTREDLLRWMEACRRHLLEACRELDSHGLDRVAQGLEGGATPAWILSHLIQHEAEHRGVLRRMAGLWKDAGE